MRRIASFLSIVVACLVSTGVAYALPADRFESNETRAAAADAGVAQGIHLNNLTLHDADDEDWFRVEILRADDIDVSLQFTHADGNLDIQVTDADGGVLGSGLTSDDNELVSLTALSPGTYYVRVFGDVNTYGLAIAPGTGSLTRALFVNDGETDNGCYALAAGDDANSGLTPDAPKATVQDILDDYDLGPTDLVVIDTGTYAGSSVVITVEDEGAAYAGTPYGSSFSFGGNRFELIDADFNLIYGIDFTSSGGIGIYAHSDGVDSSTNNEFIANNITGTSTGIRIDGGNADLIRDNTISGASSYGIYVSSAGVDVTEIDGNHIYNSAGYGIDVPHGGNVAVTGNTVSDRAYALYGSGVSAKSLQLHVEGNNFSSGWAMKH